MSNVSTIRRSFAGRLSRLSASTGRAQSQGNPITLAAIREAKEGQSTGVIDTSSLEAFIKTCSE